MSSGRPIKCVVVGDGKFLAIRQISTLICSMYKGEGEGGGGVSAKFKSFGGMFSLVKFYIP